ncbi:Mating-type protein a-1, partial [Armadillidium nasatum]
TANGNESLEGYVVTDDNRCLLLNQLNSQKCSSEYGDEDFYSECHSDKMEIFELQKLKIGSEDILKPESNVLNSDLLNCGFTLQSIDVPSTSKSNVSTKEREIFLSKASLEQGFDGEDPLFIPESSEQFLKIGGNEKGIKRYLSIVPNVKKIVSSSAVETSMTNKVDIPRNVQLKRSFPNSLQYAVNVNPNSDISNYVAVRVFESEKLGSSTMKVDDKTKEIFRELEQRIQRTPSKVKRPLTKYTIFMKEKYPEVAEQNPDKKGPEIIKILSSLWKNISPSEKQQWQEKAIEHQREFKIQNPDYIYCPKEAQDKKFEYYRKKVEEEEYV